MATTDDRFRTDTQAFGKLEQMSLDEARSRKETLQAERSRSQGSVSDRVSSRAIEAEASITRGMSLLAKLKHYSLEFVGRGPEWQYTQLVKEMYATVADARKVSENAQTVLKEYTTQQKDLQHRLRVEQQILSCNVAQISHYERVIGETEAKLQEADTASLYGVTTTEAMALHTELSGAQEKLIELNAESNVLTMQILTAEEEISNLANTIRGVQQQAVEFNKQRIVLEAYSRQIDAQGRMVEGLNGVNAMRDMYQRCAISQEQVTEMQARLRSPALEPLPVEDRIKTPPPIVRTVANKEYWQEHLQRTLPYRKNGKD